MNKEEIEKQKIKDSLKAFMCDEGYEGLAAYLKVDTAVKFVLERESDRVEMPSEEMDRIIDKWSKVICADKVILSGLIKEVYSLHNFKVTPTKEEIETAAKNHSDKYLHNSTETTRRISELDFIIGANWALSL